MNTTRQRLTWLEVCNLLRVAYERSLAGRGERLWKRVTGPRRSGELLALMLAYQYNLQFVSSEAPWDEDTLWIDDILDSGHTVMQAMEGRRMSRAGGYAFLLAKEATYEAIRQSTPYGQNLFAAARVVGQAEKDTWWEFPWEPSDAPALPGYAQPHAVQPTAEPPAQPLTEAEILEHGDATKEGQAAWRERLLKAQAEARENAKGIVDEMILAIGDDPHRAGLLDTPERVARSWRELFRGYNDHDVKKYFKVFDEGVDSMVAMVGIEFYSHCEHHMVPFYGVAHIAYIPNEGRVIGASKLARIFDVFARRLQIQERIGNQVVEALMAEDNGLDPAGAACIIEARHMCMCARGVNKQHSTMVSSAVRGVFQPSALGRQSGPLAELMQLIALAKGVRG